MRANWLNIPVYLGLLFAFFHFGGWNMFRQLPEALQLGIAIVVFWVSLQWMMAAFPAPMTPSFRMWSNAAKYLIVCMAIMAVFYVIRDGGVDLSAVSQLLP